MTMFFTFVPGPPFSSLEEAMDLYPDWKMVADEAEVSKILYRAEQGEPAFVVIAFTILLNIICCW